MLEASQGQGNAPELEDAEIKDAEETDFSDALPAQLDKSRFFDAGYKPTVLAVMRDVLQERNGIYLSEVVSEVSRRFGMARASEQQEKYIYDLLLPWAGVSDLPEDNPTVWLNQDSMQVLIEWRGLAPWGIPRKWQDICYHEQLGAVVAALKASYNDPASALKSMFNLKRLNGGTKAEFQHWVKNYTNHIKGR